MDIEFIEIQHRENVMKLMELCGIDMKEAYELYIDSGYNFEAAVNRKFNPIEPHPEQNYKPFPADSFGDQPFIPPQQNFDPQQFANDPFFSEDDIEMAEYRKFRNSGSTFQKKYPVRSSQGLIKSFFSKFIKSSEENPFRKDLEKFLDRRVNLKTQFINLSEAFNWSWKQKFPLVIFLLDFKPASLNVVQKVFSDDLLVEKVLSEQFKPYGININEYDLQPEFKPFFNLERDVNSIVICRVNHMDNIQIVRRINFYQNMEDIKKKIKQAKSECIQNELDQSNIARQYVQELRGNFNYVRPKTIKENIKMREDKKLRRQQEEEYFKACQTNPKKQEIKPEIKPPQQYPSYQPQQQAKKQIILPEKVPLAPVVAPALSAESVKRRREEKMARLKKYNDGLMFKIRVPQGKNLIVQVDSNEYVQYLFDFVECQPDDLGFANQLERKFDLFIGFGGSQTLRGKEHMPIKKFLEGSQVLIVREQ